jgi:hypothetical protein
VSCGAASSFRRRAGEPTGVDRAPTDPQSTRPRTRASSRSSKSPC